MIYPSESGKFGHFAYHCACPNGPGSGLVHFNLLRRCSEASTSFSANGAKFSKRSTPLTVFCHLSNLTCRSSISGALSSLVMACHLLAQALGSSPPDTPIGHNSPCQTRSVPRCRLILRSCPRVSDMKIYPASEIRLIYRIPFTFFYDRSPISFSLFLSTLSAPPD